MATVRWLIVTKPAFPQLAIGTLFRPKLQNMSVQPTMIALVVEGFLTRLGFGMIGFALPLYALSLGVNIAKIGLLYVLSTIVSLLMKPVMGWLADRFGRKRILVGAVLLRCLVGLLLVFATLPWQLFAIRGLQGAMTAAREPSVMALLAEHGSKRRMASAFAWYATARDLGRSLGYGVAGLLIGYMGYWWVFVLAFACSCAALLTVLRYVEERKMAEPKDITEHVRRSAGEKPAPAMKLELLRYAGFGLMVAVTAEMMRGLFPVIATQYAHLSEAQAGIAASAASIAILIAGPLFGWFADRGNRNLVLSLRSFANAGSCVVYMLFPNFTGFLTGRMLDDMGKAAFRPAWSSVLVEISERNEKTRAQTMAMLDTTSDVGEILGPIVAGLLISAIGIPGMLAVRIGLALVTEAQAYMLFRKIE
jgi:MFS family permease